MYADWANEDAAAMLLAAFYCIPEIGLVNLFVPVSPVVAPLIFDTAYSLIEQAIDVCPFVMIGRHDFLNTIQNRFVDSKFGSGAVHVFGVSVVRLAPMVDPIPSYA